MQGLMLPLRLIMLTSLRFQIHRQRRTHKRRAWRGPASEVVAIQSFKSCKAPPRAPVCHCQMSSCAKARPSHDLAQGSATGNSGGWATTRVALPPRARCSPHYTRRPVAARAAWVAAPPGEYIYIYILFLLLLLLLLLLPRSPLLEA